MKKYLCVEECCDILDSQRIPVTASDRTSGIYPYYGANGVQDYVSDYIFDDELILVAEDGGHFGEKGKPIAYRVSGKCWVNNHAHVLKPKVGFDIDYICYSLMFYDTSSIINGSTRQKLNQAQLKKMKIPVLPLEEQVIRKSAIKNIFDSIELKKRQLQSFDSLVKSRFMEMFGDVTVEQKNTIKLGSICKTMGGGTPTTKKPEYYEGNIPWISTVSLGPNYIDGSDAKGYITNDAIINSATKLIPAYSVMVGTRVGVGKSSVNTVPICTNQDINSITGLDSKKYIPLFIKYVVDAYQSYFDSIKKGATILGINSDDLKNINVPNVSIGLQKEFVSFVEQIDKSRFIVQSQIKDLQELLDSKMDEYFGGDEE